MKLTVSFEKKMFSREELPVFVDGALACVVPNGKCESVELPDAEHYFLQLGDRVSAEASVLVREGDAIELAVKRKKNMLSLDVTGGVLRTFSMRRLLSALDDEGAVLCLSDWERNAYYAMLYAECAREDMILESPYIHDICEGLIAVGDRVVGERLREVVEKCELSLPLSPLSKLTPTEESALVESYHQLWTREEAEPKGERERSYRIVMEYIYTHSKGA